MISGVKGSRKIGTENEPLNLVTWSLLVTLTRAVLVERYRRKWVQGRMEKQQETGSTDQAFEKVWYKKVREKGVVCKGKCWSKFFIYR